MNKKIIIVSVIILVLGAGGFFWWQNREIKGSPEDYVIKETSEGKIVENRKAGLTVKVPEGWEAKKIEIEEGAGILYSSETELEWQEKRIVLPLKKGCMIQFTVSYRKSNFDQIKEDAAYTHFAQGRISSEKFEEITVDNRPALKNTFETQDTGSAVGVYLPQDDKVYSFYLVLGLNEKEQCISVFNRFLENTSIK